jgi:hypothetical protein
MNTKNIRKTLAILTATTMLSSVTYAAGKTNDNIVAIGAKIGTTGIGLEARTPIVDNIYGRIGINGAQSNKQGSSYEGIIYKIKGSLLTVPLMMDYHPIDNSGFRLSAGIAYNGNSFTGEANITKNVTINNTTYTANDIGSIKTKITLGNKIAPIVSVGYDSSFICDNAWSFNAEAGVMFSGTPKVKVSATGILGNDAKAIKDLEYNANKNLNKVKKYLKIFPILSIGLKYTF